MTNADVTKGVKQNKLEAQKKGVKLGMKCEQSDDCTMERFAMPAPSQIRRINAKKWVSS